MLSVAMCGAVRSGGVHGDCGACRRASHLRLMNVVKLWHLHPVDALARAVASQRPIGLSSLSL